MLTCKECQYYKPIDEKKGECLGVVVKAEMDQRKCPFAFKTTA